MGPDQKGFEAMRRWLVGETAEQRQQWRAEVLATTKEDFNEVRNSPARVRARLRPLCWLPHICCPPPTHTHARTHAQPHNRTANTQFGKRLATMIDDGNIVAFGSKKAFSDANSELDAKDQIEMIEIL